MRDNQLLAVYVTSTLLFVSYTSLLIFLMFFIRRRQDQHLKESQGLLIANMEEGERMMNQIAKEVHDNLGQLSHLLYITLSRLKKNLEKEGQLALIENACQLTDLIINQTDNISHSLNSDFIKQRGFCNLIQDDVEHIKATGKMQCNIDIIGRVKQIDPSKGLIIYRIAQEALHNILKHSKATQLDIELLFDNNLFSMCIQDNGKGFAYKNISSKGRMGLTNMQQRAKLLDAQLIIKAEPGYGCAITLIMNKLKDNNLA